METKRLREARERLGLTQEQVAKMLGVARNTYTNWERGYRSPDHRALSMLSKALKISLEELIGEDGSGSTVRLEPSKQDNNDKEGRVDDVSPEERYLRLAEQLAAALAAQNGALDKLASSQLLAQENISRALDRLSPPHPAALPDAEEGAVAR